MLQIPLFVTCLFNLVYGVFHHSEVMNFYVVKSVSCFLVSCGVIGPDFEKAGMLYLKYLQVRVLGVVLN